MFAADQGIYYFSMDNTGDSGPLKVVHVVHSLNAGGMENGIVNMASALSDRGIKMDVCCLTTSGAFAARLPPSSKVVELKKPCRLSVFTILRLRWAVNRLSANIIHSHNWSGLFYATLADPWKRWILLQGEHAQLTKWEKTPQRLNLRRRMYARCDAIHTVSDGQKSELLSLNVAQRNSIQVVKNGVDSVRFQIGDKQRARTVLNLPISGFYIGMVARCIADKRHDRVLEAFATVASAFPEVRLLFAGDGGDVCVAVRLAIAEHPFNDRIHWLGHCDRMPEVYHALDLVIIASETEGLSNACLEAMSSGVPVLTNDSCGASEVVVHGETGYIAPLNSADDIKFHLCRILQTPHNLARMCLQARDHTTKLFSISAMVENYENLYRSLVAKSGKAVNNT